MQEGPAAAVPQDAELCCCHVERNHSCRRWHHEQSTPIYQSLHQQQPQIVLLRALRILDAQQVPFAVAFTAWYCAASGMQMQMQMCYP
jgi:hypothetical protein